MPWRKKEKGKKNGNKADSDLSLCCHWAETQFIGVLLGDVAQFLTDVLCILSLGLKEMSQYDWENYNFNILVPPSSLLPIFHYTSLWLPRVKYKWIPQLFTTSSILCDCHFWGSPLCVRLRMFNQCKEKKAKQHKWGRRRTEKDKTIPSGSQELGYLWVLRNEIFRSNNLLYLSPSMWQMSYDVCILSNLYQPNLYKTDTSFLSTLQMRKLILSGITICPRSRKWWWKVPAQVCVT